jgi:competence protein ComEC
LTPQRRRAVFWLQSLIVTSTVSGLATMPFALYHFGRAASGGFVANLLAMPIISLISAPAAAAALVLSPVGLDLWALRVFGWSLEAVLAIAHIFSALVPDNYVSLPRMPGESLAFSGGAIVAFCLCRTARAAWLSAADLVGVAVVLWLVPAKTHVHWAPSGELFLETSSGDVQSAHVFNGEGLSPLQFKDKRTTVLCEDLDACELIHRGAHIAYDATANQLILTSSNGTAKTIEWDRVVQQNGITLILKDGGFQELEKPACGQRPWRPCRVAKASP